MLHGFFDSCQVFPGQGEDDAVLIAYLLDDVFVGANDGNFITVVLIPAVQGRCDVVGFAPDLFFLFVLD